MVKEMEDYLAAQGVDQKASDALRAQSQDVIRQILDEGVMAGRNPSALLMARIRQLNSDSGGGGGEDWDHAPWRHKDSVELEAYVKEAGLDVAAAEALYAASDEVKRRIMEEDVAKCRNPSAMVMKLVKTGGAHELPPKKAKASGGDDGRKSAKICRHFQRGKCHYGDKCSFRHEKAPAAEPSAEDDADAPEGLTGEAQKDLSDALEELHTAAWDRGLPQEDFEAMLRRVAAARDYLIEAQLQDEADAAARREDEQDSGADGPPSLSGGRKQGEKEPDGDACDEELDGQGEGAPPEDDDGEQPPPAKKMRPGPQAGGPPRPSASPSAAGAGGGDE